MWECLWTDNAAVQQTAAWVWSEISHWFSEYLTPCMFRPACPMGRTSTALIWEAYWTLMQVWHRIPVTSVQRCWCGLESVIRVLESQSTWVWMKRKLLFWLVDRENYIVYMKSSFPKRDKRQIWKSCQKWVRHAILLCTEPIHCSINIACQIAIFPCLKCTARCSSFPNRYKRRTCF